MEQPQDTTQPGPTLVVHYLNDSRSQRILWLLVMCLFTAHIVQKSVADFAFQEELGLPYEIKKYQRGPDGIAPAELAAVHPLGLAPIIQDGDVTLAESGAIVGKFPCLCMRRETSS